MNVQRIVTALALTLAAGTAGLLATQAPAQAATRLGGVDVERVCQFDYGFHAYVAYWSAYGWRCNPVPGNAYYKSLDQGADLNKACRLQYGSGAYATFADVNNPYSWSCYR